MDRPMSGPRSIVLALMLAAVVGISAIIPRPDTVVDLSAVPMRQYGATLYGATWQCVADDAVAFARHLQANGVDEAETVRLLKLRGYVVVEGRWLCPYAYVTIP
jgi:hypothetical protein